MTWTFMYWRLTKNPNYYNLLEISTSAISDYLSNLTESTIEDLDEMKCISFNEDDSLLQPINLGIIASYYYINTNSIGLFADNISEETKMKQLL